MRVQPVQAYKGDFLVQPKQVRISLPSEMKGQDSTKLNERYDPIIEADDV
jgi:hypothetical protein